ncbi:hypothetical protein HMN09_01007300 [Mycena chlorophos]|uniref:Uncharacterized protein n=1 Tax=Mycena chlorophos TaxID=658473 RepID=A0A8H6SHE3_MYCCL|nr:hypothetical protein HMN09_01007300 [Mycena chlorophos]
MCSVASLLVSKYKHALEVLDSREGLEKAMVELGVKERGEFEQWLAQEKEALKRLSKEPEEETLHMEYYQKLVNLRDAEATVAKIRTAAIVVFPSDDHPDFAQLAKDTRRALEVVHELELRLEIGVDQRWHPGTEQWDAAATLVSERRYRRALDALQAGGDFPLAGTDEDQDGWDWPSETSSPATTTAARAMDPPRSTMTWDQVVNYAFIADFDLLRLGRNDIRDCAWTRAGAREAMDQHFRILRAEEERKRLDVEIRRLVTHMRDEDQFLLHHERRLEAAGMLARAYQVRKQRSLKSRFSAIHMNRLYKLSKLRGSQAAFFPGAGNQEPELEEDDTDDEGLEGLQEALEQIVRITEDSRSGVVVDKVTILEKLRRAAALEKQPRRERVGGSASAQLREPRRSPAIPALSGSVSLDAPAADQPFNATKALRKPRTGDGRTLLAADVGVGVSIKAAADSVKWMTVVDGKHGINGAWNLRGKRYPDLQRRRAARRMPLPGRFWQTTRAFSIAAPHGTDSIPAHRVRVREAANEVTDADLYRLWVSTAEVRGRDTTTLASFRVESRVRVWALMLLESTAKAFFSASCRWAKDGGDATRREGMRNGSEVL